MKPPAGSPRSYIETRWTHRFPDLPRWDHSPGDDWVRSPVLMNDLLQWGDGDVVEACIEAGILKGGFLWPRNTGEMPLLLLYVPDRSPAALRDECKGLIRLKRRAGQAERPKLSGFSPGKGIGEPDDV